LTLRQHVGAHTLQLLRHLVAQARQGLTHSDEDSIHDLRVAIRRLRECLREFKVVFPPAPRKKIRKQLRGMMKAAERVRSTDIALKLLHKAGLAEEAAEVQKLRKQRDEFHSALQAELGLFSKRPYLRTWRESLGI